MDEKSKPHIRWAASEDTEALTGVMVALAHDSDPAYAARLMVEKQRRILLCLLENDIVGYLVLNLSPSYAPFARAGIPEIQDLRIDPKFRRQGLATALIGFCEKAAKTEGGDMIGIGVGLTRDYGPAQALYTRLGYVADGAGVVYDDQPVRPGERPPFDDLLCLMMIKSLK